MKVLNRKGMQTRLDEKAESARGTLERGTINSMPYGKRQHVNY